MRHVRAVTALVVGLSVSVSVVSVSAASAPAVWAAGSRSNGEVSKAAKVIVADAEKATIGARTVRISGTLPAKTKTDPQSFDVVAGHNEGGGTFGTAAGTFKVVFHGKAVYVKADTATWRTSTGSATAAKALADRWIKTTTSIKGFTLYRLAEITYIASRLTATHVASKTITTFHGQKAIRLSDGHGDSLYFAAQGPPYILGSVGSTGDLAFSDYNRATVPAVPSVSVPLSSLTGGK